MKGSRPPPVVGVANALDAGADVWHARSVDFDLCYRALGAREPRFDGWFFTAVTSTGIYCRPSCPARTPQRENVRFYPSAAAAQQAGFRACKRCRPGRLPRLAGVELARRLVARAMRLIADGVIDRDGVPGSPPRLGYSERQLQRLLLAELGAGPLALARAQRAQTARMLIETSSLPMTDVAFAAGFASIRQFNATIREVFAVTPTELRERAPRRDPQARPPPARRRRDRAAARLSFRRRYRPRTCSATWPPGDPRGRGDPRPDLPPPLRLPFGTGIVELTPEAGPRRLPGAARRPARPERRDRRAAAGCSTSTPIPRRSTAVERGPGVAAARRRRPRPAGAAYRRRRRDGDPRGARPADLDRRRPAPRRAAGRRGTARRCPSRRRADPRVPAARGAVGDRARDARRAAAPP